MRFKDTCITPVAIIYFFNTDTHKRDTEWSSTTTVSLEHDVSKVLQETVPSARSLGAIPKKLCSAASHQEASTKNSRAVKKTESEKCCRRRHDRHQSDRNSHRNHSLKENKLTQTMRQYDSSVEGLECLVVPTTSQTVSKMHVVPRRGSKHTRHNRNDGYQETSAKGSNNELSTLLPTQSLLQAFLTSRRDLPLTVCLPGDAVRMDSPQRHSRLRRSSNLNRRQCCGRPSTRNNQRDTVIASSLSAGHGTHSAKNFNDTSDGSVHCFMDEQGNWITYTFDEKGLGMYLQHMVCAF